MLGKRLGDRLTVFLCMLIPRMEDKAGTDSGEKLTRQLSSQPVCAGSSGERGCAGLRLLGGRIQEHLELLASLGFGAIGTCWETYWPQE